MDASLAAALPDTSAAVVYFHLPDAVDADADGSVSHGSANPLSEQGGTRSDDFAMARLRDGGAAPPSPSQAMDARRRFVTQQAQAQPARLWLSYASVAQPAEGDVRRALLRAGVDVATVLARHGGSTRPASRAAADLDGGPSGAVAVTVELRRVEESPLCTHPNVWEDPNDVFLQPPRGRSGRDDDAASVVEAGDSILPGRLGRLMRRAWSRSPVQQQQQQQQAPASQGLPPLSTQRRRRALASERGEDVA